MLILNTHAKLYSDVNRLMRINTNKGVIMTDTKKDLKEIANKASETAKNIWLAGLGAYGKAVDETQEQYGKVSEKVNKESGRLFDELVAKGKKLESETTEKLNNAKEKTETSLEERITLVKESLKFTTTGSQLEEINEKLDKVLAAVAPKKAPVKKKAASTSKSAGA